MNHKYYIKFTCSDYKTSYFLYNNYPPYSILKFNSKKYTEEYMEIRSEYMQISSINYKIIDYLPVDIYY